MALTLPIWAIPDGTVTGKDEDIPNKEITVVIIGINTTNDYVRLNIRMPKLN